MRKLLPSHFAPVDPREIKPSGWLLQQLKTQAAGLTGNLDKFWPDIKNSRWIGGDADGWERMPYWLDGFIPLAWLLDDEDMKSRAMRYVTYIMDHEQEDGWLCPDTGRPRDAYDLWAYFLMLKVLVLYHSFTRDDRVEAVVRRSLRAIERHMDRMTLYNWAQARWFEALISVYWLYERTGEPWLLNLASKLRGQGFDWISFFDHWPYTEPDEKGRWSQMSHVVNNAMMLKSGALLWRMTGDPKHKSSAERMVELLDRHHGMVTGVFSGDECLAGTSPIRGTELCAVVEYMYSLEQLLQITGASHWGDRLEKIAFNALPATISPDMWTHQYDQQVNQVQCSTQEEPVFGTNGGQAHLFGLEPNYGCCTANMHQGWPKYALSTWMRSADGLVAAVHAPTELRTTVGAVPVSVMVDTDYPFKDTVTYRVTASAPVEFTLWLRIPGWAHGSKVVVDGSATDTPPAGFHPVRRPWTGTTEVVLQLPMRPELVARPNDLYAVVRGPLVYALPIKERWVRINEDVPGREYPHCDYEVYPESPWNYALCLREGDLEGQITFEEREVGEMPFSPEGAPVVAHLKGRRVDWQMQGGSAAPVSQRRWLADEVEDIQLIPYGCTNLRVTEMPLA